MRDKRKKLNAKPTTQAEAAFTPAQAPCPTLAKPWSTDELQRSLAETLAHNPPDQPLYLFGYGSLLWKPEFAFLSQQPALLRGHHRSFCLWSRVNRGTPESPGLVLALAPGGACKGLLFAIAPAEVRRAFPGLWKREMSMGSYHPRWLSVETDQGKVPALSFVINRGSTGFAGKLSLDQQAEVIHRASGCFGPATEYLFNTQDALDQLGMRDRTICALAHKVQVLCAAARHKQDAQDQQNTPTPAHDPH